MHELRIPCNTLSNLQFQWYALYPSKGFPSLVTVNKWSMQMFRNQMIHLLKVKLDYLMRSTRWSRFSSMRDAANYVRIFPFTHLRSFPSSLFPPIRLVLWWSEQLIELSSHILSMEQQTKGLLAWAATRWRKGRKQFSWGKRDCKCKKSMLNERLSLLICMQKLSRESSKLDLITMC